MSTPSIRIADEIDGEYKENAKDRIEDGFCIFYIEKCSKMKHKVQHRTGKMVRSVLQKIDPNWANKFEVPPEGEISVYLRKTFIIPKNYGNDPITMRALKRYAKYRIAVGLIKKIKK